VSARVKLVSAAFGVGFGFLLAWGGLADPDVIRAMLLLEDSYVYLMLASAVVVGLVGTRLLGRLRARALITGEPVECTTDRPERRHVTGSVLFGTGWAIACVCPGPAAVQLGQGIGWALLTFAGMVIGVRLFFLREERAAGGGAAGAGPRTARAEPALASNPD
jgi:uncharacterized membrane protein YedE/YeeE